MGSLYRSQHELVFVFKNGMRPHINNVELGRFGRNRTNIWNYAGASSFGSARDSELAMHPTVKPLSLVADAILDCSKRGGIVLDAFAGSGTTLIAAEKTGRRGYGIELDPYYADTIVRRFEDVWPKGCPYRVRARVRQIECTTFGIGKEKPWPKRQNALRQERQKAPGERSVAVNRPSIRNSKRVKPVTNVVGPRAPKTLRRS